MFSDKWLHLLDRVLAFSETVPNHNPWFRGHHQSYKQDRLHSGLFRLPFRHLLEYLNWEKGVYEEFLYNGFTLHKSKGWDLLFVMQHYGVKTRLLDWTESFMVALYFAYRNWNFTKGEEAVIWMLNPYRLNEKHTDLNQPILCTKEHLHELFKEPYPSCMLYQAEVFRQSLALFPLRNSPRIMVQKGVFTLQSNSRLPLEQEYGRELIDEHILTSILLTSDLAKDVEKYLLINGIDPFMLFPDLHGLAMKVNNFPYGQ